MSLFGESRQERIQRQQVERELRESSRQQTLLLREIIRLEREQLKMLEVIAEEISHQPLPPRLTSVRLVFSQTVNRLVDASFWDNVFAATMTPKMKRLIPTTTTTTVTAPPQGASLMPTPGPITLLVGATATATLLYFDQNGNPMPADFTPPATTFTVDTPSVVSSSPSTDLLSDVLTALAEGTCVVSAVVTTAEGATLQDSSGITVGAVPPPAAVLSSIKLQFS